MAAYCVLRRIDYIVEECPMAVGNKHLGYKEALNAIEVQSPGSKAAFYFGFLERASSRFRPEADPAKANLGACKSCGSPTTGEVCAFCKLTSRATGSAGPGATGSAGPGATGSAGPGATGSAGPGAQPAQGGT
jgi:tRNA(Ile)-lysidine synthase TilS/MesJ